VKIKLLAKRSRLLPSAVAFLGLLILSSSIIYAWLALDTAYRLQLRSALDQNRYAAEICARLLDDQWNDLQSVLTQLETRSSLGNDLSNNNLESVRREIQYCVDLVPALEFAAVYRADGTLEYAYPASNMVPTNASNSLWFQKLRTVSNFALGTTQRVAAQNGEMKDIASAAARIVANGKCEGYLLTYYRFGDLDRWLADLGLSDAMLYVLDPKGNIIDCSRRADRNIKFAGYPSFQLAMAKKSGSRTSTRWYQGQTTDLGYSYVKSPGWAVIIARSEQSARAPTKSLLLRLTMLGFLAITVLGLGTVTLVQQYRAQNQIARALAAQNEALIQSERLKTDFLSNVSHDLRTPLAALQLSVSSMIDPSVTWEQDTFRENLRMAEEGLDQISSRVRNLLEMSRLEAHMWQLDLQVSDLTDIAGAALEQMRTLIGSRTIHLSFPDTPLFVECDPVQIETVIVNMVENALKYSAADSAITLTGGLDADGANVVLHVRDLGPGVPSDETDQIFGKFYRSRNVGAVGGTGLGLAICKSIVLAHHGAIGVHNCFNQSAAIGGAEFWFALPAYALNTD